MWVSGRSIPICPLVGNLVESGHPTPLAARIRIERPEARAYFNANARPAAASQQCSADALHGGWKPVGMNDRLAVAMEMAQAASYGRDVSGALVPVSQHDFDFLRCMDW
jgi:hypothetical protein